MILILSSILRGILALIGVLVIYRFILLRFYRHTGGSAIVRLRLTRDSLDKKGRMLPRIAEFLYFSIDT